MKSLLRLFNAVLVSDKKKHKITKTVMIRTIKCGYVLDPFVEPSDALLDEIESVIGLSGEKANSAFHKSWKVVRDSSIEELVIQQIIHYFTTYGLESLGLYDKDTVYIPPEKLKLPKVKDGISLVVVKAMTPREVIDKIVELGSGVALSETTLACIMEVVEELQPNSDFISKIKNRELRTILNDLYGIVPQEPTEFLHHLVSKLTNESLLIKNDQLIEKIKSANGKFLDDLMAKSPPDLASIFFRYKPLFLAMKSISRHKKFFNQLRKRANKLHKPLAPDYLNSVTSLIKHDKLDAAVLAEKLAGASVFRKVRLARALQYRLSDPDSIVYLVRNGRGWATDFKWDGGDTQYVLDTVIELISYDIGKNVDGKTIYIPENAHYAIPATEKQFVGNFPIGSYVSVPQDLIVGIHWTNTSRRIDLDFSVIGESGKIGWDRSYRSDDKTVLFSGDMTSAPLPNGASELFYVKRGVEEPKILFVNYFNFDSGDPVTCKLFVANEKPGEIEKGYVVNPNNMIAQAELCVDKKQTVVGLVTSIGGENRVYFYSTGIGKSITSGNSELSTRTCKYLVNSAKSGIDLATVLKMGGAKIVSTRPSTKKYIDLSLSALNKTTVLKLFFKQEG